MYRKEEKRIVRGKIAQKPEYSIPKLESRKKKENSCFGVGDTTGELAMEDVYMYYIEMKAVNPSMRVNGLKRLWQRDTADNPDIRACAIIIGLSEIPWQQRVKS